MSAPVGIMDGQAVVSGQGDRERTVTTSGSPRAASVWPNSLGLGTVFHQSNKLRLDATLIRRPIGGGVETRDVDAPRVV